MRIVALFSVFMISPLMGMFSGTPIRKFFYGNWQRIAPHPIYPKQQKQRPLRLETNATKTNAQQAKIDAMKWKAKETSKHKK